MAIIDAKARELIVKDINHNYFVSAGAGSGKTTTLVQRIVTMIIEGKDIRNICAITFTKKAANEFYLRTVKLLKLLSVPADFNCPDLKTTSLSRVQTKESMENCKRALANIDLCFFGTIDSFCNEIIKAHPMDAGVPASLELTEEGEMEGLYRLEYNNILAGIYGSNLQKEALELKDYIWNISDLFPSLISNVLYNRQMKLKYKEYHKPFEEEFKNEINDFIKFIKELHELDLDKRKLTDAKSSSAWCQLDNLYNLYENNNLDLLNEKLSLDYLAILDLDFESSIHSYDELFIEDGKKVPYKLLKGMGDSAIVRAVNNYKYYKLIKFLDHAIPKVSAHLKNIGKLTFFDNLLYVSDLLEKDASNGGVLIRHIRRDYKYFFLDEFQDTDPLQAKIFFYLSTDNPKPNWYDCQPEDGSLFIVGDEKQSIYAFRGANIDSFLSIKEMFKEEERLNLICNFRSQNNILEYFNQIFSSPNFFGSESNITYPMLPTNIKDPNKDSIVVNYNTNKIAPLILDIINNDKDKKISYKDFMVITKGTSHHNDIIKELEEYGIPYNVEGKIDLSSNKALKILFSLLIMIVMPNKENMFSILHQLGFNEQEIYLFKSKGYKFDLNPIDEMPVLLIDIINKLHDIKYVSYTELFDNVIKTFDLFSLSGIKNMEYTYFILEKVRSEIESLSIITEKEFVSYLRDRIKGSIDFEATSIDRVATLSNDSDAVSVANLHKVKGLEARIVILYDENEKDKDPEKYIDRELDERYIFGFSNGFTNVVRTNEYMDLQDIARRKDFEEVRRLLYVAATRAKERLFICRDSSVKNSYWDPLRLAYDINGNIIYEIKDYEIKTLDPIVPELGHRSSLKVLNDDIKKETYKIVLPSKEVKDIKSKSNLEVAEDDTVDELLIDNSNISKINDLDTLGLTSTVKGTMVHKLMEEIALRRFDIKSIDIDSLSKSIVEEYTDARPNSYKEINDKYINVLKSTYNTLINGGFTQNKNYADKDIINTLVTAEEVHTELPFCYKIDGVIYNGVIDLLYKDNLGYHIIDYKTNKNDIDLDKHYQNQLSSYINALNDVLGIKAVDAKIYHIDC